MPLGLTLAGCGGGAGEETAGLPTGPSAPATLSAIVDPQLIANSQATWPEEYFGETVLDENATYGIQAAIDATPNDLVVSIATAAATGLGNGIYSFPVASEPHSSTIVFLDGTQATKDPQVLSGPIGQQYRSGYWWAYQNFKIYVYQAGAAFAGAALVKPWNIQLKGSLYDGYVSKPGVVVTGMGSHMTRVEQLTSRSLPLDNSAMEFVVASAAYSGRKNLTVNRGAVIGSPSYCCGEYIRVDASSSSWFASNSPLVILPSFKQNSGAGYHVGIFFGSSSTASKNIRYYRSPIINRSIRYSFETFSWRFKGSVFFEESPIRGTYTIDGAANTFVFLSSPKNASSLIEGYLTPSDGDSFSNEGYAYNLTPTGPYAPFSGFDFIEINIDSPAFVPSRDIAFGDTRTHVYVIDYGTNKPSPVCWMNSPVSGDGRTELLLAMSGGLPPKALLASQFYAEGSEMPTLLVSSLSRPTAVVTTNTPQVGRIVKDGVVRSVGATPMYLGCFAIAQGRLAAFRRARITVSGSFAATSSAKQLNFRAGTPGALAPIHNKSGAFSGSRYQIITDLLYANDNVEISIAFIVNGTAQSTYLVELPLAQAARFGFEIEAIGGAGNSYDIVANLQMIELG